jgi:hypothetical protein
MATATEQTQWMKIRKQLLLPVDKVDVVAACPSCGSTIGTWKEGGLVEPHSLWTGEFVCECGWKPEV